MRAVNRAPVGFSPGSEAAQTDGSSVSGCSPSSGRRDHNLKGTATARARSKLSATPGELAPRACEKCRASKRRCDKTLPHCARCVRLNADCVYLPDAGASNPTPGAPLIVFQPIYQQESPVSNALLRGRDPLEDITTSQILAIIPDDSLEGEQNDWQTAVRSYFDYVHSWYAVVHRAGFDKTIASIGVASMESPRSAHWHSPASAHGHSPASATTNSTPTDSKHLAPPQARSSVQASAESMMRRELALLIVAMYLIVRERVRGGRERSMFDEVYRSVKRMLALALVVESKPKLELIQASALLALYEYGHGDSFAAYRTLSEAVAAARVVGVEPGWLDEAPSSRGVFESVEEAERSGLWWAMFILDQFIHRDETSKTLPFILDSPTTTTLLPGSVMTSPITHPSGTLEVRNLCEPTSPPARRFSINVPISPSEMESFQLSAKVATLLHSALVHDHAIRAMPHPKRLPPVRSFAGLDEEIRRTTLSLLGDDINWQVALDCFAMCVSALFTLYLPFLRQIEQCSAQQIEADPELKTALAALRFAAQLSTDISCKINKDIASEMDSVKYLAAPASATCYLVVIGYVGMAKVFPEQWPTYREDIVDKFESLRFFGIRWGIADKMIRQLQTYVGLDQRDFVKNESRSSEAMDLSR